MTAKRQADLFVPPMPADVAAQLDMARGGLRAIANDIDEKLGVFFHDAWEECFTRHTDDKRFELVKCDDCGSKTKRKALPAEEFWGTPDFNEFDKIVHAYEKATRRVRELLWDVINDTAVKIREGES